MTVDGNIINRSRQKISIRSTVAPVKDSTGRIVGFIETVEDVTTLQEATHSLRQDYGFGRLLGRSPQMEELFKLVPVIAGTDSSVLITGETGTGKDALAEVIHEASDRADGPFIKINCGAVPETLLESELFGHKRGAFTGAVGDKPGRIRLANGGTLYLTEIGDLSLSLQVKLLTFLDDKVVYPLGGTKGVRADARVIAATHRDLENMVNQGDFRQDLLYRLNVVRMELPPLRERTQDIGLLLDHFLKTFAARFGKKVDRLSPTVQDLLLGYHYPGNVRELRNIVEYAANICGETEIGPDHLPAYLLDSVSPSGQASPARSSQATPAGDVQADTRGLNWAEIERNLIVDALVRAKGKRTKAAEMLGWCRSTLWRKMKQYQLEA